MAKRTKLKGEKLAQQMHQEFNIDVSGYPDAIERTTEIISNIVATSKFLSTLVPQTGIKANTQAELNIFRTDVTWSNADCVSTETGNNSVLEPRYITVKRLTDRELLCLDKLDAKVPQLQNAGANNEELTWSELFMQKKIEMNAKWLAKLAWQGDTTIVGATNNLNKANGWLKIMDGETADLAYYNTFSSFTTSNAISIIEEAVSNRSAEMYEMEDLIIVMNNVNFDILARAYTAAYGLHNTGVFTDTGFENQAGMRMMKDPNSGILIVADSGMDGNGSIVLSPRSNFRFGTDLESDYEKVELFFDKYHRQLVSDIIFAMGFQYELPENIVYLKYVAS